MNIALPSGISAMTWNAAEAGIFELNPQVTPLVEIIQGLPPGFEDFTAISGLAALLFLPNSHQTAFTSVDWRAVRDVTQALSEQTGFASFMLHQGAELMATKPDILEVTCLLHAGVCRFMPQPDNFKRLVRDNLIAQRDNLSPSAQVEIAELLLERLGMDDESISLVGQWITKLPSMEDPKVAALSPEDRQNYEIRKAEVSRAFEELTMIHERIQDFLTPEDLDEISREPWPILFAGLESALTKTIGLGDGVDPKEQRRIESRARLEGWLEPLPDPEIKARIRRFLTTRFQISYRGEGIDATSFSLEDYHVSDLATDECADVLGFSFAPLDSLFSEWFERVKKAYHQGFIHFWNLRREIALKYPNSPILKKFDNPTTIGWSYYLNRDFPQFIVGDSDFEVCTWRIDHSTFELLAKMDEESLNRILGYRQPNPGAVRADDVFGALSRYAFNEDGVFEPVNTGFPELDEALTKANTGDIDDQEPCIVLTLGLAGRSSAYSNFDPNILLPYFK